MKKILFFLQLLFCCTVSAIAQKIIVDEHAQVRQHEPFDALNVNGAFEIILIQDDEQAVVVSAADEGQRNLIESDVKGGTLYLSLKKPNTDWRGGRKFRAFISVKNLRKIDLNGFSNLTIENTLNVEDLQVSISGSSDFRGKIQGRNLKLASSGSSDFYLSGKVERLSVVTSGSSDMKARDLQTDYCDITGSGTSLVEVYLHKEMMVNVSGGCKVYYLGNGIVKEFNATGKATLQKLE